MTNREKIVRDLCDYDISDFLVYIAATPILYIRHALHR